MSDSMDTYHFEQRSILVFRNVPTTVKVGLHPLQVAVFVENKIGIVSYLAILEVPFLTFVFISIKYRAWIKIRKSFPTITAKSVRGCNWEAEWNLCKWSPWAPKGVTYFLWRGKIPAVIMTLQASCFCPYSDSLNIVRKKYGQLSCLIHSLSTWRTLSRVTLQF